MASGLILAVPKGRILNELQPLLERVGIRADAALFDESDRRLTFPTDDAALSVIRVRSFDVATFVAFGAAQVGICGSDVLMEFDYPDLYAPVDLGIGHCRISMAEPADLPHDDLSRLSHVRIATKYPHIASRFFAEKGIQAECIKLSGAMELAPSLGLSRRIVDLVSSGKTLKANGLKETEVIAEVSSRLIVHRASFKTQPRVAELVERFREAVHVA